MTSRASRVLLSVVLFLGLCSASLPTAFGSAASGSLAERSPKADTAPAATGPVTVAIKTLDPQVPSGDPKQALSLKGTFTAREALTNVSVQLRVASMNVRSEMQLPAGTNSTRVQLRGTKQPKPFTTVAANSAVEWSFPGVVMADLGLTESSKTSGVYAVDVAVADDNGKVLGSTRTYLAWKPVANAGSSKFDVALLWPVVGPPALDGVLLDATSGTPEVIDTRLQNDIAPKGRLDQLLDLGKDVPGLTWAVDPDLYTNVGAMASAPYKAKGASTAASSTEIEAAKAWQVKAQSVITKDNCWKLPYADPDVISLAHAGASGALVMARSQGLGTTLGNCGAATVPTLLWPANGYADQKTVDLIHASAAGGPTVLTNGKGSVTLPSRNGTVTPTGHARAYGSNKSNDLDAAVSDPDLDALFTDAAQSSAEGSMPGLLAGQKWLAQTALIAREGTYTGRIVLATAARSFTPTAAMVSAIKAGVNWTQPSALKNLFATKIAGSAPLPTPPTTPNAADNLSQAKIDTAATSDANMQSFLAIQLHTDRDGASPLRSVATFWRGPDQAAAQAAYAAAVARQVDLLHSQVSILDSSATTLSGKSGKVPITIVNKLGNDVRVQLTADSKKGTYLSVDPASQKQTIIVPASTQKRVFLSVSVRGNGQAVPVVLQLLTPSDGTYANRPYGTATEIKVTVSRIGLIALALLFGSAAVIVVAIGLRVLRANRAHHGAGQDTMAS